MFYILVLSVVLLVVLIVWSQFNSKKEQSGGNSDRDIVIAKELVNIGNSLTDLGQALIKNITAVQFTSQSLDKITGKLHQKGELSVEDHRKLRDIVQVSKLADDQREKIEQDLGDSDSELEEKLKELKLQANKNHETLAEISNQLSSNDNDTVAAPLRSDAEQQRLQNEVQQTTKAIKEGCPVCPLYTETNPVNILEISNQGFGSIAPKGLGPNYV